MKKLISMVLLLITLTALTSCKQSNTYDRICRVTNIETQHNKYTYTIADEDENLFKFTTDTKLTFDWMDVYFNDNGTSKNIEDDKIIKYEELK